LVKFSR